ncbi:MAG: FeS cluster assembly protein SufD [Phycisphaerae bacterium]|nr:FeS cluster assembly protein SufD [Phycisphaerae bacterium]
MTDVIDIQDTYAESFARLSARRGRSGPAWVQALREAGLEHFRRVGFPTLRDEDWRFTNVKPIAQTPFVLPEPPAGKLGADALQPLLIAGLQPAARLVFVDGCYSTELSDTSALPVGVSVQSVAQALDADPATIQSHMGLAAEAESDPFIALNAAFLEDGAFVRFADNTTLKRPIVLLSVATRRAQAAMTHPRNLIVVGRSCEATVIEHYASAGGEVYLTNAVTELVVGDNSTVHHYVLELESEQAFNLQTLKIRQGRDTTVNSHTALLGGAIVRNNVHPIMDGENGHCLLNGLYVPRGRQHMDSFMFVEHARPHCDSRQFYKGILADRAGAVFSGRIKVHPGAQKTDAKQTNQNLLLSGEATVDTKPQLEIYADDVKCTHGATVGELDEQAMYYLQARGISADAARAMLTYAFAAESLERMNVPAIGELVGRELLSRLPRGRLLAHLLESV